MGCINLIKMNIFPRLLYPLQMLPLWLSKKVAADIERAFSRFIWHGKRPRQKIKTLQLPADRGGLALPNIYYYNWACHARSLWEWLHVHLNLEPCLDSWVSQTTSLWSVVTGPATRLWPFLQETRILPQVLSPAFLTLQGSESGRRFVHRKCTHDIPTTTVKI